MMNPSTAGKLIYGKDLFLDKDGGTRALCQGCKSYRTEDTFTGGTQAPLTPKATLVPDKSGKRRRKWLAYIVIELDWVPEKIHHQYRRRFGIECSYRIMRRVRAMTISLNPVNPRTKIVGRGVTIASRSSRSFRTQLNQPTAKITVWVSMPCAKLPGAASSRCCTSTK